MHPAACVGHVCKTTGGGVWPPRVAMGMTIAGTATSTVMPIQVHGPMWCTGMPVKVAPIEVAFAASVSSKAVACVAGSGG